MERARGGLTTEWHIAVDTFGRHARFILTGGNASDARSAIPLLTGLNATHVLADKPMTATPSLTTSKRQAHSRSSRNGPACYANAPSAPANAGCEAASSAPSDVSNNFDALSQNRSCRWWWCRF